MVMTTPIKISNKIEIIESAGIESKAIKSCAFPIPCWSISIPKKSKPKPANTPPIFFTSLGAISDINTPTPIIGSAIACKLILKPINEMIQPIDVLPILAPIMTPIDCTNVNRPALTNPIVNKVVAVDD